MSKRKDLQDLPKDLVKELSKAYIDNNEPGASARLSKVYDLLTHEWQTIDDVLIAFWAKYKRVRRRTNISKDLSTLRDEGRIERRRLGAHLQYRLKLEPHK
ncbi:MAG: hypothetical protein AAF498_10170 [Pseudomonadota bacterium]